MSGVVIADVRGNDRDETAAGCLRGVNWPVKLLSSSCYSVHDGTVDAEQ